MGTTGRWSPSLSSNVALTRPEISSDFTQEITMDLFTSLDELLRKMPLCSAAFSATQFEFSWRAWQVEVSPSLR